MQETGAEGASGKAHRRWARPRKLLARSRQPSPLSPRPWNQMTAAGGLEPEAARAAEAAIRRDASARWQRRWAEVAAKGAR